MRRLPIRLRLALCLHRRPPRCSSPRSAGFGYVRLASGSSHDLDLELRQRAQDLIGPVSAPGASLTTLAGTGFVERGESFAEVVTPSGAAARRHADAARPAAAVARRGRGRVARDGDLRPRQRPRAERAGPPARHAVHPVRPTSRAGRRRHPGERAGEPAASARPAAGGDPAAGAAHVPRCVRRRRRGPTAGRGDAPACRRAHRGRSGAAAARPRRRRRADPPRGHAQRPAGPGRGDAGARAVLRGARQPRAAHAARAAPDRARARRTTPAAGRGAASTRSTRRGTRSTGSSAWPRTSCCSPRRERDGCRSTPRSSRWRRCWRMSATGSPTAAARAGRSIAVESVTAVVRADPQQLRQALTNLVGNALEHGAGVVRLSARPDGEPSPWSWPTRARVSRTTCCRHATERFVRSRALDRRRARAGHRRRRRRGEPTARWAWRNVPGAPRRGSRPGAGAGVRPAGRWPVPVQACRSAARSAAIELAPVEASCGRVGHQGLDPRVGRRRDAVQPAEQGDLAVEVVGLDARTRGPGSARSTRRRAVSPATGRSRRWSPRRSSSSALGDRVDPGRREDAPPPRRSSRSSAAIAVVGVELAAAQRLDGVAEVVEELAVLPAHDVRPRARTRSARHAARPPAPRRRRRCRRGSRRGRGSRSPRPSGPCTTPGSRCSVGIITHMPVHVRRTTGPACARWPRRSAPRRPGRRAGRRDEVAGGGLGVLALGGEDDDVVRASRSSSRGWAYAGIGSVTRSSGVAKVSPRSRIASPWAPAGDQRDVVPRLVQAGADASRRSRRPPAPRRAPGQPRGSRISS